MCYLGEYGGITGYSYSVRLRSGDFYFVFHSFQFPHIFSRFYLL